MLPAPAALVPVLGGAGDGLPGQCGQLPALPDALRPGAAGGLPAVAARGAGAAAVLLGLHPAL